MAKKDRISRDQKRKAKLAKRASKAPLDSSLAYTGNKYKTEALVPVFMATETGIHEADVAADRQLTDRHVTAALTKLILQMRQGPLPPLADAEPFNMVLGQEDDLIIHNIRINWRNLFESHPHPGADKLQGVLRTLLDSVHTWSSRSPHARGYLQYLTGFLKQAGVSVRVLPADADEFDEVEEPEEDELLALGRAWYADSDVQAGAEFRKLVEERLRAGDAEDVLEICQQLMGEIGHGPKTAELSALAIQAHRQLQS